jgi:uncharacterized protein (DUF427 family)
MNNDSNWLDSARAQWLWRGQERPPFADVPASGQLSVWDFPRPPELVREAREIVVLWGNLEVARTRAAWAVRETAHPPTFYLPLVDVQLGLLHAAGGGSFCEWKGPARYWHLVDGARRLELPSSLAGWRSGSPNTAFAGVADSSRKMSTWHMRRAAHRQHPCGASPGAPAFP